MTRLIVVLVASLALPAAAAAAPLNYRLPQENTSLRPGAGAELVQANCGTCHSLDYIAMQPPQRGDGFWQATVAKMIKTYQAPVSEPDATAIAAYLSSHY